MTTLLRTRRPRLLLALFCLALWTPGFFTLPPGDRDESRFTQATKQMLETGDFIRIMNGAEARNRKPIGIYWLQAPFVAAADAAGLATANPVWPYRLPSALGGLVAVLACFWAGERLVGRAAALLGAAMLAACAVAVVEVHIAKTDAALLSATTVAMAVLARAYLDPGQLPRRAALLFWLSLGAGVLLKGPITPMIAGTATLALLALDRRAAWLRALRPGWGVPLLLAVVLPWFVAIGLATHGRFFADAVGGDLGRKLTSGDDAHWGPPGLHLLLLPLLLFPATAALPGGAVFAWRERRAAPTRFLLAWIVPAWLVFEATPTKLPHYTLPLYPAICLLLAAAVVGGTTPARRWIGPLLAALAAALLAAAGVAAPLLLHLPAWIGLPALLAAGAVGWWAVRGDQASGALRALMLAPLLYGAVLGWELPRLWPLWLAPRVVAALPRPTGAALPAEPLAALPPGPMAAVGFAEPSLMFLAGTGTRWLSPEEGAAALADGAVDALVVGDRELGAVRAAAARLGLVPRVRAEEPGFNYSRGRPVVLTVLTR